MAGIPVTIHGMIYYSDVGVGGGPMPGGPPLGIWGPGSGFPSHPIAPGGPPPGIWPSPPGGRPDQGLPQPPGVWPGQPPRPDQGLPGQQPGVSHPIAPGGQPPGIWPAPGHPDQGLPGGGGAPPGMILVWIPGVGWTYIQAGVRPDQGLPGQPPRPDQGLPGQQPGVSHPIAPGGQPGQPTQPIAPTPQPKK
jgi:hypothetical protein